MRSLVASLAIVVGAVTPPPFVVPTAAPSPAPDFSLPTIGRTRAVSPICATLRDVVLPAVAAVKRGDARFAQTRARLPDYVDIIDDPYRADSPERRIALARLDSDVTALLAQAADVGRALDSDRLAPSMRAALEQLYDIEGGRADLLSEYVQRERVAMMRGTGPSIDPTPDPDQPRDEPTEAPSRMPQMTGIAVHDRVTIGNWTAEIDREVGASETQAAHTLLPLARSCGGAASPPP